jgi:membrane-bound serine protease (ClpP class)
MKSLIVPFILQFIGIIVVIVEVIIPTGGILAIAAIGLLGYSLYLVFTAVSSAAGIGFVVADLIVIPVALTVGFKLLAHSPATLRKNLSKEDGVQAQSPELTRYVGMEGVAVSDLRPSGTALIDGKRLDVVSRGEYLEKSTKIVVTAVTGNQIIVKQTD